MDDAVADLVRLGALEKRFGFLRSFDCVVLAVSGGGDSTALMRLVHLWARQSGFDLDRIEVATVDHRLRPGSGEEADAVNRDANQLGLRHSTLVWQGRKPQQGIQNAAREARYKLLHGLARARDGRGVIVTAHTVDDQAETVLMRLARGSGPDGLAAVPVSSTVGETALFRPLLDVTHATLLAFLQSQQAAWIEDPTNDERAFERIRIRQAGDARSALGLSDAALVRTARRMARARQALEASVDDAVQRLCTNMDELRFGVVRWPEACGALPDEIAIRLLRRVIHALGGQAALPQLGQIEKCHLQLNDSEYPGGTLCGVRLMPVPGDGGGIMLFREVGRSGLEHQSWDAQRPLVWDRRFKIERTGAAVPGGFTVKACGGEALAQFGADQAPDLPVRLPREVKWTLPAIWDDDRAVSIPSLGLHRAGYRFTAQFLQNRLIASLPDRTND